MRAPGGPNVAVDDVLLDAELPDDELVLELLDDDDEPEAVRPRLCSAAISCCAMPPPSGPP